MIVKCESKFFSQQQVEVEDGLLLENLLEVEYPKQFKVVIHNDNFTSMDFVTMILKKYFHKTGLEAKNIMLMVHSKGRGIAGIYIKEIAETKIFQATQEAKQNEFPLRLSMELNE